MKKITILLVLSAGVLFADQIDVTVSEGTDQSVIASLSPKPASPEVDADSNITLCFNEPLLPMRMPRTVTLTKLQDNTKNHGWFGNLFGKRHQNTNERIRGNISYDSQDNCLIFDPDSNLSVGFYEVQTKPLMIRNTPPRMVVSPISYRFYVPEVINGFKLPPEPDEDKNNETLLGIDFNDNGIRDDVERLIIIEEAKNTEFPKTQTAISLQYAFAWQKMIEAPTIESRKYLEDASACQEYFVNKNTKGLNFKEYREWEKNHASKLGVHLEDAIFNTKERILRRFEFNRACSGHIFDLSPASIDKCMINIDKIGE